MKEIDSRFNKLDCNVDNLMIQRARVMANSDTPFVKTITKSRRSVGFNKKQKKELEAQILN